MPPSFAHETIWLIAALAIFAIIARPWGLPEAIWAVAGAAALVIDSLVSWAQARSAILEGTDVYLFLAGMMLLAELARTEGLFDWVAALAVRWARGAPSRLFALVYLVGIVVTALLSNDATAVVLTPAVYAAATKARTNPLPYLLICAFIANAASFLLPISNPANLVVFASHLPPLPVWLGNFLGPSTDRHRSDVPRAASHSAAGLARVLREHCAAATADPRCAARRASASYSPPRCCSGPLPRASSWACRRSWPGVSRQLSCSFSIATRHGPS